MLRDSVVALSGMSFWRDLGFSRRLRALQGTVGDRRALSEVGQHCRTLGGYIIRRLEALQQAGGHCRRLDGTVGGLGAKGSVGNYGTLEALWEQS